MLCSHLGLLRPLSFLLTLSGSATLFAQSDRFANVVIETTPLTESVYMLTGAGGNLAVSAGPDGLLLVDDQFAPMAVRIEASLRDLPGATFLPERPLRYVINTHHHGDHTGGNAYFAALGATLVASEPARVRLLAKAQSPDTPLPVITYSDGINLYFNGDRLQLLGLHGHTDGDTAVFFERDNVLHTGDLFFNGRFPYIDTDSGGGVLDYMASQAELLDLIDDDTQVIPGHGPLARRTDLAAAYEMIKITRAGVAAQIEAGGSLDAIQAQGVPPDYKSYAGGFISEERWLETLYRDVQQQGRGG